MNVVLLYVLHPEDNFISKGPVMLLHPNKTQNITNKCPVQHSDPDRTSSDTSCHTKTSRATFRSRRYIQTATLSRMSRHAHSSTAADCHCTGNGRNVAVGSEVDFTAAVRSHH